MFLHKIAKSRSYTYHLLGVKYKVKHIPLNCKINSNKTHRLQVHIFLQLHKFFEKALIFVVTYVFYVSWSNHMYNCFVLV